jgi:hypothetical protein
MTQLNGVRHTGSHADAEVLAPHLLRWIAFQTLVA